MDSTSLELSLSLKPNVPKTIPNLFKDISKINNVSERLLVLNEYLHQHQQELARIQGLKQEFPQCMLFLEDAIETLKKEVMNTKNGAESESKRSMMEESSSSKRRYDDGNCFRENPFQPCKFSNGCSSFQGFSSMVATKQQAREVAGGSTHGELNFQLMPLSQPIWKNKRRSWTPKLHASFVEALEYLGGPGVATPKHIRNRMQVEGLTNDQVKSHLQKYRLHCERLRSDSVDPAEGSDAFQNPGLNIIIDNLSGG